MNDEQLESAKNAFFIALGIDMAVTAVALASDLWAVNVFEGVAANRSVGYIDFWIKFSALMVLTWLGVGWTLASWLGTCYTFAKETLKVTGLLHERWKVWGWIVPGLNLFKPYQVVNEIYKVGAVGGVESGDWKKSSGSIALLTWWIVWVISHLVQTAIGKIVLRNPSLDSLTRSDVVGYYYTSIFLCSISLVVAGLWFVVAGSLTRRLQERSAKPFVRPVVSTNAAKAQEDNDAYAAALAEIEEDRLDKGVWARSFAESGGDESKAKALYIKARAESTKCGSIRASTNTNSHEVNDEAIKATEGEGKGFEIKPIGLYEAAIGEKNQSYYVAIFDRLDQESYGLNLSWNWAAFLFTGFWALYRKMYGWFFAFLAITTIANFLYKSPGSEALAVISYSGAWLLFTAFANSLYHLQLKARIAAAQKSISDPGQLRAYLGAKGGVHTWVPILTGAFPVVGILAAVALPAYQDYTKRQASPIAFGENDKPARQLDLSEFQKAAGFQTSTDWNNGVITPPPTAITGSCSSSSIGSETTQELCKHYWAPGASSCDSNILQELVRRGVAPHQDGCSPGTRSGGGTPQQVTMQTSPASKSVPRVSVDAKSASLHTNQSTTKASSVSAEVQADLNAIAARAISDYPYLDTPAGHEVVNKILKRRDEFIQQGFYPSIALTRAVNEIAPANAPQVAQEQKTVQVVETEDKGNHSGFPPGCRWVTPQQWSCK